MIVLEGYARFATLLSLEAVASLISARLFGGLPFVATDEFDEVPGVRLEHLVLGLSVRVCGEGGGFELRLNTKLPGFSPAAFPELNFQNIDAYLEQALGAIDQFRVVPV